jgi:hypothetical protein
MPLKGKQKTLPRKLTQVCDRDEVPSKATRVRSRAFRFLPLLLELTAPYGCPEGKSKIQKPHICSTNGKKVNLKRRSSKLLFLSNTLLLGLLIAVIVGCGFPQIQAKSQL